MSNIQELITDLEQAIVESRVQAKKLAAAGAPHGLKTQHKVFWEHNYFEIQVAAEKLMQAAKVYDTQSYVPNLPWQSEEFTKYWNRYLQAFYEANGYPMPQARAETQLDLLPKYYTKAEEAVEALQYFLNKGYFSVFKINKQQQNGTEQSEISATEFE